MGTITTTSHLPYPPSTIITLLHDPSRLFHLNPLAHAFTASGIPSSYTLTLHLPFLFNLIHLPVHVAAHLAPLPDGVLVTTASAAGVRASSRWTVVADPNGGSNVVEEFVLMNAWFGLHWFVMATAGPEHAALPERLAQALKITGVN